MKTLIGTSFSWCAADIANGNVKLEDVKKIISRTTCKDTQSWEKAIQEYKDHYWDKYSKDSEEELQKFVDECARIAFDLIPLTEQPKLEGKPYPIGNSRWVEDESEISWSRTEN